MISHYELDKELKRLVAIKGVIDLSIRYITAHQETINNILERPVKEPESLGELYDIRRMEDKTLDYVTSFLAEMLPQLSVEEIVADCRKETDVVNSGGRKLHA